MNAMKTPGTRHAEAPPRDGGREEIDRRVPAAAEDIEHTLRRATIEKMARRAAHPGLYR